MLNHPTKVTEAPAAPIDRHDALTGFLYDLARDHVPVGTLEHLVRENGKPPYQFPNLHLAALCTELARTIRFSFPRRYAKRAVDLLKLDPGVRLTVAWLRDQGFETTDSGDGKTKLAEYPSISDAIQDGLRDEPHVVIRVAPDELIAESDRLESLLMKVGVRLEEQPPDSYVAGPHAQATYDPANRIAFIDIVNLTDELLAAQAVRYPEHEDDPGLRDLLSATEDPEKLRAFVKAENARWDAR
jgi:hypothetical protein